MTKRIKINPKPIRILSFGAGVQSSTIAMMMLKKEIEPADAAIFADTGAESKATYRWLEYIKEKLPFPLYIVMQKEGLTKNIESGCVPGGRCSNPPFFTSSGGILKRSCTLDFKVAPIMRQLKKLGACKANPATQVFGISIDELKRTKKPNKIFIRKNEYPLVELDFTRYECILWMTRNGFPIPPRSACVYCPYRCAAEWQKMKDLEPEDFAEAVRIDKLIRNNLPGIRPNIAKGHTQQYCYVHRTKKPLDEVSFIEDPIKESLFSLDCEGMCGV